MGKRLLPERSTKGKVKKAKSSTKRKERSNKHRRTFLEEGVVSLFNNFPGEGERGERTERPTERGKKKRFF